MIPQLISIGLMTLGLGAAMAKHGEPKTSNYNVGVQIVSTVINITILYFGGFWDCFL